MPAHSVADTASEKVAINEAPLRLHDALPAALDYVRQDPGINEVILSGGDPLLLSDVPLERLVTSIDALPSVEFLRLHSRARRLYLPGSRKPASGPYRVHASAPCS